MALNADFKANPHELCKGSDIRLTKRAIRARWKKTTTFPDGNIVTVSFAPEDYGAFTTDLNRTDAKVTLTPPEQSC